MTSLFAILFFPWVMAYMAASDLLTMTISNRLSLLLILGFFIMAFLTGMSWTVIGWHLLAGLAVLSVTFLLFAFNLMGGGDAKIAAATAIWFGFPLLPSYLVLTCLLGGAVALGILILRIPAYIPEKFQFEWLMRFRLNQKGVPYGIAMSLSALITYASSPWMLAAI